MHPETCGETVVSKPIPVLHATENTVMRPPTGFPRSKPTGLLKRLLVIQSWYSCLVAHPQPAPIKWLWNLISCTLTNGTREGQAISREKEAKQGGPSTLGMPSIVTPCLPELPTQPPYLCIAYSCFSNPGNWQEEWVRGRKDVVIHPTQSI